MKPMLVLTKANLLRFFRDKVYIFFMFILPVMFLLIFGMIYGNDFSSFNVAIFNHSSSDISTTVVDVMTAEDGVITRTEVSDEADAEDQLIRGEISAIIELPADFGQIGANGTPSGQIKVIYGKNNEQAGQAITAVVSGITTQLNSEITGQSPSFGVEPKALMREGLTNFDYVFAGLLGYTVLTIGLMGIANILPGDKESGAVKRLRATNITPSQLILSYALTFLILGILIFIVMILLGLTIFNFNMRGSWLTFSVFTAISTIMMLGFGLAVGGWARNEAQASALGNILMFPMMFLSGVFFPMFLMPEFVQVVTRFIPLTPVVDGIRLIITENFTLIDVMPQLGAIGIWAVIIYFIAIKTFRWD